MYTIAIFLLPRGDGCKCHGHREENDHTEEEEGKEEKHKEGTGGEKRGRK